MLWCSEAEARQRKQEQSKADMLAANERQMQLKASSLAHSSLCFVIPISNHFAVDDMYPATTLWLCTPWNAISGV